MVERLRIAQVAPIAGPVAPHDAGSIPELVYLLTETLVRRGHTVTLFATSNSQTSAALHAVYARGYDYCDELWDWEFHEVMHVAAAFERAHEFDIIHSHAYHFALPFTRLVSTPVVHSYHILPNDDIVRVYARYPDAHLVAVSQYQRQKLEDICSVPVIYHGIDTNAFPFNPSGGDYLLFLGRIMPHKGPLEAIQVAKEVGMRLVITGPCEDDYFDVEVAPLIDGRQIEYVGPVDVQERNTLLSGAAALLYPVVVPEPFGLVMVEAMACGTPVAAFRRGAVPEIVEEGVTGYCGCDVQSLAASIPATLSLDRSRIRQEAVRRFDYRRMVADYEALYERVVSNEL